MAETFAFYTVIFIFYFLQLNFHVISLRRRHKIPLGDGGNDELIRARTMHANFLEFSTVFLLALLAAENTGVNEIFLHLCGLVFFGARLAHIYAIRKGKIRLRVIGISGSHTAIVGLALGIIARLLAP